MTSSRVKREYGTDYIGPRLTDWGMIFYNRSDLAGDAVILIAPSCDCVNVYQTHMWRNCYRMRRSHYVVYLSMELRIRKKSSEGKV